MDSDNKQEIIKTLTESEFKPEIEIVENVDLASFEPYPFEQISMLGTVFLPMTTYLQNMASQVSVNGNGVGEILYRVNLPKGATHLAAKKDGSGLIGAAFSGNNKLVGQATLTPVQQASSVVKSFDPSLLVVSAMLMSINQKLNDIKQLQDSMIEFMEQKEKSKLEGNLYFLSDIINNYKLNWNNEKYKSHNYTKVLDIKQDSEQSVAFARKQAESSLKDNSYFYFSKEVSENINKIRNKLADYRLAVYMYAFSSYVEVLLLENFEREYLCRVVEKILKYSFEYRDIYAKAYSCIEQFAQKSTRSLFSKGLSGFTKGLGKAVENIPLVGDNTQIDENLIGFSERVKDDNNKSNNEISRSIVSGSKVDVSLFTENIKRIDHLYNDTPEVLISGDTLYIGK